VIDLLDIRCTGPGTRDLAAALRIGAAALLRTEEVQRRGLRNTEGLQ
jgi:hypothetical protein